MEEGSQFRGNAMFYYEVFTRTWEMKLLRIGFLLKRIFDTAEHKVNGTLATDYNVWMSFAHDTTIASLLDSLGLFYPVNIIDLFNLNDI